MSKKSFVFIATIATLAVFWSAEGSADISMEQLRLLDTYLLNLDLQAQELSFAVDDHAAVCSRYDVSGVYFNQAVTLELSAMTIESKRLETVANRLIKDIDGGILSAYTLNKRINAFVRDLNDLMYRRMEMFETLQNMQSIALPLRLRFAFQYDSNETLEEMWSKLDSMSEPYDMLRLVIAMQRQSQFMSMMSQIMKVFRATQDAIVQNMK